MVNRNLRNGKTEFFPGRIDLSLKQNVAVGMDYYMLLCWEQDHRMEENIREWDKDIRLF